MPIYSEQGYIAGLTAGSEVSSTYEGRYIQVLEEDMVHPEHTDGLVDKGDPVVIDQVVGVALDSAAADSDYITVDTEGIFNLSVIGTDDSGDSTVAYGNPIFINTTTGLLSKIRNLPTQQPFGTAKAGLTGGTTGVIAVKVHMDPEFWDYFHTITVDDGDNAYSITTDDEGEGTGGISNSLYLEFTNSGAKTGTGTINVLGTDLYVNNDVPYAYIIAGYNAAISDHDVGFLCGIQMYMEDCGNDCGAWVVADLNMNTVTAPAGRHAYIRCREHGAAVQANETIIQCEGAAAASFLLTIDTVANMLSASGAAGTLTHKIACDIPAGTVYLYLYSS